MPNTVKNNYFREKPDPKQKVMWHLILFKRHVQKRLIHRDRERILGCQGLGEGKRDDFTRRGLLFGITECSKTGCGESCVTVNAVKTPELCV